MRCSTQNTVSVFIASSFELHDVRVAIGDCFRQLNDDYEKVGIRVKLNCWEDYKPEYVGERKQDEYNRDLVLNSQILIALFKTRCGLYTQEEVKLGLSNLGKDFVHCFYEQSDDVKSLDDNIAKFFSANNINSKSYSSIEDICNKVVSIVQVYIKDNCSESAISLNEPTASKIYATIPSDLLSEAAEVGNIIRQLDLICERNFKHRCKLSQFNTPIDIQKCDYYVLLYNKEFSETNMYELEQANMCRSYARMNALAIYEKPTAVWEGSEIKKKIDEWGHFPIRLEHWDVFRLKTLIYIISNLKNIGFNSLANANLITFKDNRMMCFGMHIGQIETLNVLKEGLFTDEIDKLYNIQNKLQSMEKELGDDIYNNPTKDYLKLIDAKKNIEQRLLKFFTIAVDLLLKETECTIMENQRLRDMYGRKDYRGIINDINTKTVAVAAINDIALIGDRKKSLMMRLEQIELKIKSYVSVLMSKAFSIDELNALYLSFDDKISVQESAYKYRLIQENDIITTLHQYISVVDTWMNYPPQREDILYTKLVQYADKGKISNIEVENIRVNYANYLSRNFRYKEAFEQYEIVINRLLALKDDSRIVKKTICQTYLNYISCFDEFYDESYINVLNKWKELIENYVKEDDYFNIELVNLYVKQIHHLPLFSPIDDKLVVELERALAPIVVRFQYYEDNDQHNLLYNVIILACFYIDRFYQSPPKSTKNATYYLNVAQDLCEQYIRQIPLEGLVYDSMINHNYGFLMARNCRWSEAEEHYEKAYQERKCLYEYYCNEETKTNLAETAVNYSDCLFQSLRYDDAIKFAKMAMEFYRTLIQPEYEHTYMNFYKAQQMLGTIYVNIPNKKEEGLNLLGECWRWAEAHPDNSYQMTFVNFSFKILNEHGRV